MKRVLKSIAVIVIGVVMIALTACSALMQGYEDLYDDPDLLLQRSYGSMQIMHVQSRTQSECKDSCNKFSGYYECFDFTVSEETKSTLSVSVEAGKLKVVLAGKKAVYVLSDGDYEGSISFAEIPAGKYSFALIGVEAKYSLTFTH